MKTTSVEIIDAVGNPISGSRALIWGNNAAWLCSACDRLLANRTGDLEFEVDCPCGIRYEILRTPHSKNGRLDQGPASGIRER